MSDWIQLDSFKVSRVHDSCFPFVSCRIRAGRPPVFSLFLLPKRLATYRTLRKPMKIQGPSRPHQTRHQQQRPFREKGHHAVSTAASIWYDSKENDTRKRRRLATLKNVKEVQEKNKTVEVPKSGRAVERMESVITNASVEQPVCSQV